LDPLVPDLRKLALHINYLKTTLLLASIIALPPHQTIVRGLWAAARNLLQVAWFDNFPNIFLSILVKKKCPQHTKHGY